MGVVDHRQEKVYEFRWKCGILVETRRERRTADLRGRIKSNIRDTVLSNLRKCIKREVLLIVAYGMP